MVKEYQESGPYRHLVIGDLVEDELLQGTRDDLRNNIQATLKETDIYKVFQTGDLANINGLPAEERALLPHLSLQFVFQTGDLANIDGLPAEERALLPHLRGALLPHLRGALYSLEFRQRALLPHLSRLRGALYSLEFRRLVAEWTGAGPLSGAHIDLSINAYGHTGHLLCHDDVIGTRKGGGGEGGPLSGVHIDLSINAYGHTGHLLCHDDVIGTRKVSYILYLVDPSWDKGEKPDGGALQLYPLAEEGKLGTPAFAPSKVIPPQWNQMVLFAVDPGRSFHDEVFSEEQPRLSISGWFHGAHDDELKDWSQEIIQQGKAHEERFQSLVASMSTLAQLESGANGDTASAAAADPTAPGPFKEYAPPSKKPAAKVEDVQLGDWINPQYLEEYAAPSKKPAAKSRDVQLGDWINTQYPEESTQAQCRETFESNGSTVQLHRFLKPDVADKIAAAIRAADAADGLGYMEASAFDVGVRGGWKPDPPADTEDDAPGELLRQVRNVFATAPFRELLQSLTGLDVNGHRAAARRFRPGLDYTLATPQSWDCGEDCLVLDAVLCFVDDKEPYKEAAWVQDEVGGYHTYLGGDDGDDGGAEAEGAEGAGDAEGAESAGAPDYKGDEVGSLLYQAPDAAVYKADEGGSMLSADEGNSLLSVCAANNAVVSPDAAVYKADEGGSLLSVSAANNALSLVLRDDAEVLSFIKYVSAAAPGSRYDVAAEYVVAGGDDDDDGSDQEGEPDGEQAGAGADEAGEAGPASKRRKAS
ncbi:Oxoglutarate and iron-dependent oxygenase degradation C-term-domain-containing protein [Tribonema minus]|uniref:Oxoglutarate and iron-dependent oxygenase degradation C-term-domain-containing protein n=1 Tax=Tribonema minus TaxID=303371 RepID=A0A836CDD7_9STRA|nr:Oxoglutarate and iron-dependent oxygenase degradation C-term-domain-containing protein [Tribonema minus]